MTRERAFALICVGLALGRSAAAQQDLLRQAARLDAEHKCGEAERDYRQALGQGAPSAALLNNLGNHYMACGQPDQAQAYYERVLKLNPAHANANLQLARLAAARKDGTAALRYLSHVQESDPEVRLLRAEALHWAGRRAEAAAVLDNVRQQAGADARLLYALGLTEARLGLYDRAEAALNAVLAQHPNDFDVLLNLGRAAARAGHYARAQQALAVALKLQPDDVDAMLELGRAYAAGQDPSRAVFVLAQARQRAPKNPEILLALARAAEDAGYYGDSALAYDEYLRLRPADDAARRDRALVEGYTGAHAAEARNELTQYIQRHPGDPLGHYKLAQLTWKSAPDQALAELSAAVRLAPDFAAARFSRAWLLHRLGRTAESLPDLQAAARLSPRDPRVLAQLGLVYLSLDQPAEAEKILRRAQAIAPQDPDVLMHLGRALIALGRDAEGQGLLEQFQKLRPQRVRGPRAEPGLIELAGLPAAERTRREIDRLRGLARAHPDDPEFQFRLASLLLAAGRSEDATAAFRDLQALNAGSQIWEQAGTLLLDARQYELAREFLERAAKDRPAARLDLALALFFTSGPQPALQMLEQAPAGDQDYLLLKARILDAAGRSAEAERVLEQGLRHAPSRPQVAEQAALLLLRHRRAPDALDLLARALQASPGDPDLLLAQAITLGLAHRNSGSEKMLDAIESRWPEWDRPYVVHGLVLEQAARAAEARRKFETAVALGSPDLTARCAATRAEQPCACRQDLYQWLFTSCDQP